MSWSAPPLHSPGAMYRLAALVLALVWGTAPVLAVFHSHSRAEVHRYCAEHRGLEDAIERGDQALASESNTAAVRGSETARPHSACVFGRFCRFDDVFAGFVLEVARVLEATPVPAPNGRVGAASIAVIVVAPKTSPPV